MLVATQLHLPVDTVKHCMTSLQRHFGVTSRRELIEIDSEHRDVES